MKFKDFSSYKADGKPERPKENLYEAHRAQYWSFANGHLEELETSKGPFRVKPSSSPGCDDEGFLDEERGRNSECLCTT